jgi:DNA-binding CsgD family transcriptional regulator
MAAMLRKLADEPKKAEAVTALLKEIEHEQRAAQPVRALGQKESTEGRLVPAQIHQRSHTEELVESLSPRELDVLQLMAEQLTNNEIARRLVISPVTARNHTVHIYDKLNVRTRREAVARARAFGML